MSKKIIYLLPPLGIYRSGDLMNKAKNSLQHPIQALGIHVLAYLGMTPSELESCLAKQTPTCLSMHIWL